MLTILLPMVGFSQASDLFFSEYIEGSGNVKYLEIFNGTGVNVDLSDYEVLLFSNGSSDKSSNSLTTLTGSLANGAVLVIANKQAEVVYAGDKVLSDVTFFNGDDALAIRKKSTSAYVDIFGTIGEDPGSEWTVGGLSTANKTLIRKSNVTSGVLVNPASGFPTLATEWIMKDTDDISDLGKHSFDVVANIGESDAILDASFTFGQTIDPLQYTAGTTALASGIELLRFVVRDGGEDLTDEDELPTNIVQLKLSLTEAESIAEIGVFANDVLIGSTEVESPVVFINTSESEGASVSDGTSKVFSIKALFSAQVKDGASVLVDVEQLITSTTGSGFIQHASGLVISPKDQPYQVLDVVATKLAFVEFPIKSKVDAAFGFKVQAQNSTGSVDVDFSGNATLSVKTGTSNLTFLSGTASTATFANGSAAWNVSYPTVESLTLTASNSTLGSVDATLEITASGGGDTGGDYEVIAPGLKGAELITYLRTNYSVTKPLGYNGARDKMYAYIDNHDGVVRCVYTGYEIQVTNGSSSARTDAFDKGINTEHTFPQGYFDSNEPMRGDIHHLFPTREDANGARSNYPLGEIDDNATTKWFRGGSNQSTIPSADIRDEFSESTSSKFEPREDHKGNAARALFYFWTMYSTKSNLSNDAAYFAGMKSDLFKWHRLDLVDKAEIRRSDTTAYYQGNRNPFVHDTSLVARAYFPETVVSVEKTNQVHTFTLEQNYPNPFNPSTAIRFSLHDQANVKLRVFDVLGKEVAVLVNTRMGAGDYTINFNASKLNSGVYFYQLLTQNGTETKKMMLIK